MSKKITIGISDMNIAKDGDILVTYALGSCVGICLYDNVNKIAGMSHIMLPTAASMGTAVVGKQEDKFADLAVPKLLKKMEESGARRAFIKAKIAGGAQMFANINNSNLSNIGDRNVIAVKEALNKLQIRIVVADTGNNYGRTQTFDSSNGVMTIRSACKGEWVY